MSKARVELSEGSVRAVIERDKPKSLTGLAHGLGYRGSVSSTLTKKFRQLFPDIDVLLKRTAESAKGGTADGAAGKADAAKPKAKPASKAKGKWARDARNPFRDGSAYATCFDILAAHKDGLPKAKLVELLAKATGKDNEHSGYDAQVILSAHGAAGDGLNPFEGPRHRSCRPGFWVRRTNGHVRLMVH